MGIRLGVITGRALGQNRGVGPVVRLLQVQLTDEVDAQTVQLVGQMGEESNPPDGTLVVVVPGGGNALKVAVGSDEGVEPVLDIGGKRIYAVDADNNVIAEIRLDPDGTITETTPNCVKVTQPDGTLTETTPEYSRVVSPDGTIKETTPECVTLTQPDGTYSVTNAAASITMNADGTFFFSGVSAEFDCPVTAPKLIATTDVEAPLVKGTTDVEFGGKSAIAHTHGGVVPGFQQTDPPT